MGNGNVKLYCRAIPGIRITPAKYELIVLNKLVYRKSRTISIVILIMHALKANPLDESETFAVMTSPVGRSALGACWRMFIFSPTRDCFPLSNRAAI